MNTGMMKSLKMSGLIGNFCLGWIDVPDWTICHASAGELDNCPVREFSFRKSLVDEGLRLGSDCDDHPRLKSVLNQADCHLS
jgi:hypothetical protein